jgi:autotransporter-associated beta strand protein
MKFLLLTFRIVAIAVLFAIQSATASTNTWIGNTSNLWSVGSNWSGGLAPANGDTLVFGTPGSSGLTLPATAVTLGGNATDGIDFAAGAGAYTINTSGLTLNSSNGGVAIRDLSPFTQAFSASSPLTLSGAQTFQVGATTGSALSAILVNSAITGGFRLTKTGTGYLGLAAADALTGLTVNGGTVSISADNQLSSTAPVSPTPGWIVLDGGALRASAGFTINATRGIALGNAAAGSGGTLSVAAGTLLYNGVIANNGGTNSLTKTGVTILSLGGTNTYTGETRINQGQLSLDFTQAGAPASDIVNSSSALVMGGIPTASTGMANALFGTISPGAPILFVQGSSSTNSTQTFAGLSVAPGFANLASRGNGSNNVTVALGAISHNAGGTANFSLLTSGGTGQGIFTTTTANTNGILGGWATTAAAAVSGTAPLAATDWAANDGSGNIVAYTGYTIPSGAAPVLASNAASNIRLSSASTGIATLSAAGVNDLNTIQATDTAARTIAIGTGNTLRLGVSGGVWNTANATGLLTIGATTATGGTLTAGGAADAIGEIVFNSSNGTTNTITVNSAIANNGNGTVSVVKTGSGAITLNGANTYTGGTYVNQGAVTANATTALGSGDVTVLSGGKVILFNGASYANNFNIAGDAPLVVNGATVNGTVTLLGNTMIGTINDTLGGTINGKITGDYSIAFTANGPSATVITLSNQTNDYTGHISIFSAPGNQAPGAGSGSAGLTIKLGADNVIPDGVGKGNVIIAGNPGDPAVFSSLDLNGKTETINGLTAGNTGAFGYLQSRVINTANGTTASLTLGDNDQTSTYAGRVLYGGTGAGTGDIAITKTGAGKQTFAGANTYKGATTVNAGTLVAGVASVANVSGAFGNNSAVTMANAAGATLDLAGFNTQVGSLTGGGATGGNVALGAATLTTGGDNTSPAAYAGVISGTGGVAKIGTGTQVFAGANTYTGSTMVTVGTLVAQADKALGDSSSVVVNGGTLDIRSTTAGTVTLGANANLSLSSGTINLQLGTTFDQLVSSGTGAFTITGGIFALDVTGGGFSYANTYAVLSGFGGANSRSGLGFTGYDTINYTASLGTDGVLSFTAVPESSTWILLAGAGTFFMVVMRRRRRRL